LLLLRYFSYQLDNRNRKYVNRALHTFLCRPDNLESSLKIVAQKSLSRLQGVTTSELSGM